MYKLDEDYPETDPGNQLRIALNETISKENDVTVSRLSELLYTANERGIAGFYDTNFDSEIIENFIKLLEIAKRPYTNAEFKKFRM